MALTKCKECKKEVSNSAKVCPHCGIKNPGVTFFHQLLGIILIMVILAVIVSSCSGEENTESSSQELSIQENSENPLDTLVKKTTHHTPQSTLVIDDTQYMSIIFDRKINTADSAQLDAKRLMPVLLESYPNINRFFMAWTEDDLQVIKIQFEREQVKNVHWKNLLIKQGELQKVSSMYWAAPKFR